MRFLTLLAVLLAGALVAPAWAGAATVSISEEGGGEESLATLLYEAGPGEGNDVVINGRDLLGISTWLVTETGPGVVLTPGAGCATVAAGIVSCSLVGEELALRVVVNLGDEGDGLVAAGVCGYIVQVDGNQCVGVRIDGGGGGDWLIGNDLGPRRCLGCFTRIRGGEGDDRLFAGEPGSELVGGLGNDYLEGARGVDVLRGGPGNERIYGFAGDDRIFGGGGDDLVWGGGGRDVIAGDSGRDTLRGGPEGDQLLGGPERDTFYVRDGFRDRVRGGSGRDRARIDVGRDVTSSVERLF
jgi:Ca2+-binding RTX toxin-like protein